jgi:hypothetical protein
MQIDPVPGMPQTGSLSPGHWMTRRPASERREKCDANADAP